MKLTIQKPFDAHLHLRQGAVLSGYAQRAAAFFQTALVMPNTRPPILTSSDLQRYRQEIKEAVPHFQPVMSFHLHSQADIVALKQSGAVVGKYFPVGLTHSVDMGKSTLKDFYPILQQMEEEEMVLSVHCEAPLYSGEETHPVLEEALEAARCFPKLRVVLEHLSLKEEVEAVLGATDNVAGTLTAHHLSLTATDFVGSRLNPHLFCKPILQGEKHRQALQAAAFSGHPRIFFGSDSAPHPREAKEGAAISPGIYSMPVTIPLLACLFEKNSQLEKLESFVSVFGRQFYRLPQTTETLTLVKKEWIVPEEMDGVVPLFRGESLSWLVEEIGV